MSDLLNHAEILYSASAKLTKNLIYALLSLN